MRKLKTLPISQLDRLVKEERPIYVLNTSSLPSGDKGMVIVNFFDGNRREFFKMPPTFIPMAITDSIPPQNLLNSKDFRQCLLKGMLTLVEPASAEAYLSTPDAQDEYESLVLSEHSAKAQNIDINKSSSRRSQVAHTSHEGNGPLQDVSAVDTVSNKVRGLMESLVAGNLTEKEVLTQLRRHQSALGPVDFSYVSANTTNSDIKKWAKSGLTRSSQQSEDEDEGYEEEAEEKVAIVAEKSVTKPKKNREIRKEKNDSVSFDFVGRNAVEEMSPEELAADEAAKSVAMSQQAIHGQSKYNEEVNRILQGSY